MAGSEPNKLAVRSLSRRPAETILLIIGIALGIGTTAGGVSMVAHLRSEGNDLIQSTQYREIVVSTRENASDMEVPAYINESTENVLLTGEDLAAREMSPDVEYAYIAGMRRSRISNFNFGGQFQRQTVEIRDSQSSEGGSSGAVLIERPAADRESADGNQGDAPTVDTRSQTGDRQRVSGESGTAERGAAGPQSERSPDREPQPSEADFRAMFQFPEYDGPEPVLEEITTVQITPEYFNAYGIQPAQGSLFTQQEIDAQRPVVVLGAELAVTLYEDGLAMGRELLIGRSLYEIIGIAEPTGERLDEYAFYPTFTAGSTDVFAAMARAFGFGSNLRFTVYEADRLDEAKAQLQSHFDSRYGPGAVVVRTPGTEARATIVRNTRLVTIILFLAIAGLLIAAVNVSNILYGRAMRKRKSIGILKALGATRNAVFTLFLDEALAIGIIGAILGIGVSIGFTQLLGETFSSGSLISLPMILGAVGGLIITLGLTIIPALQASAIPAAEALRYE